MIHLSLNYWRCFLLILSFFRPRKAFLSADFLETLCGLKFYCRRLNFAQFCSVFIKKNFLQLFTLFYDSIVGLETFNLFFLLLVYRIHFLFAFSYRGISLVAWKNNPLSKQTCEDKGMTLTLFTRVIQSYS